MNPADFYRAVYLTLFRLQERHDLRSRKQPANDGADWHPLGAA